MTTAISDRRNAPPSLQTYPSEPDEAFGRRLRSRDPAAMERFFDSYFGQIYGRVRGLVGNTLDAEDLTQEVFLKIYRAFPRFDPTKNLRPWVFAITVNHLRDHWRSRRLFRDADRDNEAPPSISSEQPHSNLERQELDDNIKRAVYRLPLGMRSVLLLRIYDGLSFSTIADLLKLTPGTARKRYSRALGSLRGSIPLEGTRL